MRQRGNPACPRGLADELAANPFHAHPRAAVVAAAREHDPDASAGAQVPWRVIRAWKDRPDIPSNKKLTIEKPNRLISSPKSG